MELRSQTVLVWWNSLEMSSSRKPLPSLGPRETVGRGGVTRAWVKGLSDRNWPVRGDPVPELGPWSQGPTDWMWNHGEDVERCGEKYHGFSPPPTLLPSAIVSLTGGTYQEARARGSGLWSSLPYRRDKHR